MNDVPCHHSRRNVSNWQRDADAQRRVYAELAGEFQGGLHALTVKALTPAEQSAS